MTPSSVAVVVDASVAVKWVLPEEHTDRAHALMAASIQRIFPLGNEATH